MLRRLRRRRPRPGRKARPWLLALAALSGAAAGLVPAGPAPAITPLAGPLHTAGNQILDAANRPVRLRGVAVSWLTSEASVWSTPDTPLDPNNLSAMPRWGATSSGTGGINVVRVQLGEQFWEPDQCQYVPGYQATVKSVVDQITSEGMVALLDLHWNTRYPCAGSAGQQDMADPDALAFWASVGGVFAGNPLVAFDLYNEPHVYNDTLSALDAQGSDAATGDDWDVWLGGGLSVDAGVPAPVVGMQQMYDAIRATGAQNLVFVDGDNWSGDPPPADHLVQGSNIVYAEHVYSCVAAPCPTQSDALPASVNRWAAFYGAHPTMITEFGYPSSVDGTFDQNVISWAEAHGVGWTAFAWDRSAAGGFGFLQDLGSDLPTTAGVPVQQGVALNS